MNILAAILSPRVIVAIAAVLALAMGGRWCWVQGAKGVEAEWDADIARRTAQALAASEVARATEQALQAKVRKVDRAYQDQKRATDHVARAAADGLRNLEQQITAARAASSSPGDSSGDAADPRLDIIAECAAAYRLVDQKARELADQVRALQAVAAALRVSDPAEKRQSRQ